MEPVNLFGAEQISLSTPHNAQSGPYLDHNATFAHASSSDELGDLFAVATPLLQKIDATDLSTVLGVLAQGSQGEGKRIAAGIQSGTQLAGLLDRTVNSQLVDLNSFANFSQALAGVGARAEQPQHAQINAGLPSFNAEEADYEQLLNRHPHPVLQ